MFNIFAIEKFETQIKDAIWELRKNHTPKLLKLIYNEIPKNWIIKWSMGVTYFTAPHPTNKNKFIDYDGSNDSPQIKDEDGENIPNPEFVEFIEKLNDIIEESFTIPDESKFVNFMAADFIFGCKYKRGYIEALNRLGFTEKCVGKIQAGELTLIYEHPNGCKITFLCVDVVENEYICVYKKEE